MYVFVIVFFIFVNVRAVFYYEMYWELCMIFDNVRGWSWIIRWGRWWGCVFCLIVIAWM